jgi:hypothetical protein
MAAFGLNGPPKMEGHPPEIWRSAPPRQEARSPVKKKETNKSAEKEAVRKRRVRLYENEGF